MHVATGRKIGKTRKKLNEVFSSRLADRNFTSKDMNGKRLKNKILFVAKNKNRLFRMKKIFTQVKKENKKIPSLLNKRTKILKAFKRKLRNKRFTKDMPISFSDKYTPSYLPISGKKSFLTSSPVKNVEEALIDTKKANNKVLFEANQKEKRLKEKIIKMEKMIKNVEKSLNAKEKILTDRVAKLESVKEKAKEREKIINETSPIVAPIENMMVERKIEKENKILETMTEDEPTKTNKIPLIAAGVVVSLLLLKG